MQNFSQPSLAPLRARLPPRPVPSRPACLPSSGPAALAPLLMERHPARLWRLEDTGREVPRRGHLELGLYRQRRGGPLASAEPPLAYSARRGGADRGTRATPPLLLLSSPLLLREKSQPETKDFRACAEWLRPSMRISPSAGKESSVK